MIDLFFNLLNLGIFIGVVGYAVNLYMLPQLRENIFKEYREFADLHQEHATLVTDQNELEESIAQQEDQAKTLFKKINQWRNVVEIATQAQKDVEMRLREDADAKVARQAEQYALKRAYKRVAPLVIDTLSHDLTERYSDDKLAHSYITTLLDEIGT